MKKYFYYIIILLFSFNVNAQKSLKDQAGYEMFESLAHLNKRYPRLVIENLPIIELSWESFPPNDIIFIGLQLKDTLVKIVSNSLNDYLFIRNNKIDLREFKKFKRFYGGGFIRVAHFPNVYTYRDKYIIELYIAGCNSAACKPFFLIIEKHSSKTAR